MTRSLFHMGAAMALIVLAAGCDGFLVEGKPGVAELEAWRELLAELRAHSA